MGQIWDRCHPIPKAYTTCDPISRKDTFFCGGSNGAEGNVRSASTAFLKSCRVLRQSLCCVFVVAREVLLYYCLIGHKSTLVGVSGEGSQTIQSAFVRAWWSIAVVATFSCSGKRQRTSVTSTWYTTQTDLLDTLEQQWTSQEKPRFPRLLFASPVRSSLWWCIP